MTLFDALKIGLVAYAIIVGSILLTLAVLGTLYFVAELLEILL